MDEVFPVRVSAGNNFIITHSHLGDIEVPAGDLSSHLLSDIRVSGALLHLAQAKQEVTRSRGKWGVCKECMGKGSGEREGEGLELCR